MSAELAIDVTGLGDLETQRAKLLAAADGVKGELDAAKLKLADTKARAFSHREFAPPAVYRENEERVKKLARRHQEILRKLSLLKMKIKQEGLNELHQNRLSFESVAREMLDPETFLAIQRELTYRRNHVLSDSPTPQSASSALGVRGSASGMRVRR